MLMNDIHSFKLPNNLSEYLSKNDKELNIQNQCSIYIILYFEKIYYI